MVIGRSSTGAIKINTDEAGGGLRAVNCACCGGGGGCNTQITEAQFNAIRYGGYANFATLSYPRTKNTQFWQDYEYSGTNAGGATEIFGSISGGDSEFYNFEMRDCVYSFPEGGPSGTYTMPEPLESSDSTLISAFYSATIYPEGTGEYHLSVVDISARIGCYWCSGTEPDDSGFYTKSLGQVFCGGEEAYRFFMQADETPWEHFPDSPCP